MRTLLTLVAGVVLAGVVYLATSGHVVFLPMLLVLPPVLLGGRRHPRG